MCENCDDKGYVIEYCANCNGSGQGSHESVMCWHCKGSGVEVVECDCTGGEWPNGK